MKTYNNLLHMYKKEMALKDIPSETMKVFLFELCNERNIDLYLNLDNEASEEFIEVFNEGAKRILNHEPMNYVLGYCWFYGYKLKVNKDVLIPRYETEELVGNILARVDEYYGDYQKIKIADIGTGSGAIAISLVKEESKLDMVATDISDVALEVAKENARINDADIRFMCGDMLKPLIDNNIHLDILISNPPYIPSEEDLEVSVKDFEPHVALFGGEDGLKYYRTIFENADKVLNENAMMGFEIGYNQKESLIALAREYFKDADIEVLKDINGKNRMMFIKL
ncbi:MAG: peptide chain release factor N(5)-glutamine methyltransferase [Firmicutes bacterium]|nr:peptide chain release factor N(5)-glutamine methyltransferase [Bacillota bacterium]MDY3092361.1 peptide chain release factor N(5)-glutamine methyltransferase [Erysipelotrichaceae bacterium]